MFGSVPLARKSHTSPLVNPEPEMGTSGPCVEVVAGVTTPPAGLMIAAICGDGTDVNDRLSDPLPVTGWLRTNPVPLVLIELIVAPEGIP